MSFHDQNRDQGTHANATSPRRRAKHRDLQNPTRPIMSGLLLAVAAFLGWLNSAAGAPATLTDIGPANPSPGTCDIYQLGNTTANDPGGLNFYDNNANNTGTTPPGQTFTTGNNPGGYVLNTLALKTSGNGSTSPGSSTTYALYIYTVTNVSAGNATLLATCTATATFTENDWLQWTNLGLALNPNSLYAFAHARTGDPGNAWERISVANGNPYAGGQIATIPAAGGAMNFGTDSSYDMTFDLGLKPATVSPTITTQPVSEAVYPGQTATFAVTAAGNAPLYYKWQKAGANLTDHANISGSATPALTISNVSAADTNNYEVVVSNSYGAVTSSVVALSLNQAPEILAGPASLNVAVGQTAQLSVSATATETLSYQWEAGAIGSGLYTNLTDGGNISGSASPTLTISNPGEWNQADYVVVISDAAGQAISRAATVGVGTWEDAGQGGIVTAVAVSPDGAWIASGGDDATVKLWRAGDNSFARTLAAGGLVQVTALAFGPVGVNIIAAGYYDGTIRLWNTTNGLLVRGFTNCYGKITSLAFSPNGQQLAVGCGDWITRILRLSDGAILNNGGAGSVINYGVVRSVAYSPDGSKLAVAGEDTNQIKGIVVLDGNTWAALATLFQGFNNAAPDSNSVTSLAFSPDGATLVSGCLDQTICFWRTSDWGLVRTLTNAGPGGALTNGPGITALAFPTNSLTLFSGDQTGAIQLWASSANWTATRTWTAHAGAVRSLASSVDGARLVSGGDDHQVRIWQTTNGAAVTNLTGHTAMVTQTCFAPDGSMIASAGNDGSLWLWTAQTGAPVYVWTPHTNQVSATAFSPDATFLVSGGGCLDNTICLWGCEGGALLPTSPILTIPSLYTNGVTALAVSPDASLIAAAGDRTEQVITLWNRSNGSLVGTLAGHTNGTSVLAFSPNGQSLASGGMFNSGTLKLWKLSDGTSQTFAGHTCTVVSVSFNPTGTLLASAGQTDGLVKVWQTSTGTLLCSLSNLAQGARAVAFSPDGTLLAAAGSDSIVIWQTSNWQPAWFCTNETVGINALSFSPNGAFLVFGRADGTVARIWNPLAAPVQISLGAVRAGQFTIANPSYSPFLQVQVTSDLSHWNVLTNLVSATNVLQVTDPSLLPAARFYRVSTPQ